MTNPPIVTRRIDFDAGHRLLRHESKCANLHGHRYVAEVTCRAEELDTVGRVIDFSVIKQVVGGWIDEHWDHAFIYYDADEAVKSFMANGGGRSFSMKCEPTAENMSQFLLEKSRDLLKPFGIDVVKLRLYETPNCWAEAV